MTRSEEYGQPLPAGSRRTPERVRDFVSAAGAAIASRATVCSNDVAADLRYLTNQATTGSELIVPVVVDGDVVETLDIEDPETNAFGAADEALFEEIAAALSPLYGRAGSGAGR